MRICRLNIEEMRALAEARRARIVELEEDNADLLNDAIQDAQYIEKLKNNIADLNRRLTDVEDTLKRSGYKPPDIPPQGTE